MLVEAKYVVRYTEVDGWGYDVWERGYDTEGLALGEVEDCNMNSKYIRAEYLGLKIVGN